MNAQRRIDNDSDHTGIAKISELLLPLLLLVPVYLYLNHLGM